ncbi:MAG: hypothetical protein ABEN55_10640, partial [Bradymonadaceae bacterium]
MTNGPWIVAAPAEDLLAVGTVAILLLFASGCTSSAAECTDDSDCQWNEQCVPGGGVFVGGGRCVDFDSADTRRRVDTDAEADTDAGNPRDSHVDTPEYADGCGREQCNGRDDDCDGTVDEPRPCSNRQGVCGGATVVCRDGRYSSCG